jgi:hypothetical protein
MSLDHPRSARYRHEVGPAEFSLQFLLGLTRDESLSPFLYPLLVFRGIGKVKIENAQLSVRVVGIIAVARHAF